MKKTHIVCILDSSGSMTRFTSDVVRSFNTFIEDQRDERGEALLTLVKFDTYNTTIHNRVDFKNVKPLSTREYYCDGMTAMYDAIGETLERIKDDKVFVIIQTDGKENESKNFTADKIKRLIADKKSKGWGFLFLAVGVDIKSTSSRIGLENDSVEFSKDSKGIETAFGAMSGAASNYRSSLDTNILMPSSYKRAMS